MTTNIVHFMKNNNNVLEKHIESNVNQQELNQEKTQIDHQNTLVEAIITATYKHGAGLSILTIIGALDVAKDIIKENNQN